MGVQSAVQLWRDVADDREYDGGAAQAECVFAGWGAESARASACAAHGQLVVNAPHTAVGHSLVRGSPICGAAFDHLAPRPSASNPHPISAPTTNDPALPLKEARVAPSLASRLRYSHGLRQAQEQGHVLLQKVPQARVQRVLPVE